MPRIAFIGVRISWLMLARNSLLALLAASATRRACRSASAWRRSLRSTMKATPCRVESLSSAPPISTGTRCPSRWR